MIYESEPGSISSNTENFIDSYLIATGRKDNFLYKEGRKSYKGDDDIYLAKYYLNALSEIYDAISTDADKAFSEIPSEVIDELTVINKEYGSDFAEYELSLSILSNGSVGDDEKAIAEEKVRAYSEDKQFMSAYSKRNKLLSHPTIDKYNNILGKSEEILLAEKNILDKYPGYNEYILEEQSRQLAADNIVRANNYIGDKYFLFSSTTNSLMKIAGGFANFIPIMKKAIYDDGYDWSDAWIENVNSTFDKYRPPLPSNASRVLFGKTKRIGDYYLDRDGTVRDRDGFLIRGAKAGYIRSIAPVVSGEEESFFSWPTAFNIVVDGTIQLSALAMGNELGLATAPMSVQRAATVGELTVMFANENYKAAIEELGEQYASQAARYALLTSAGQAAVAMLNPMETNAFSGINISAISKRSAEQVANTLKTTGNIGLAFRSGTKKALDNTYNFFYNVSTEGFEGALEHAVDQTVRVFSGSGISPKMDLDLQLRGFALGAASEAIGGLAGSAAYSRTQAPYVQGAWLAYINGTNEFGEKVEATVLKKFGEDRLNEMRAVKSLTKKEIAGKDITDEQVAGIAALIDAREKYRADGENGAVVALNAIIDKVIGSRLQPAITTNGSTALKDVVREKETSKGIVNEQTQEETAESNVEILPEAEKAIEENASSAEKIVSSSSDIEAEIAGEIAEWHKDRLNQGVVEKALSDTEIEAWDGTKAERVEDVIADEFLNGTRLDPDSFTQAAPKGFLDDNPNAHKSYVGGGGETLLNFAHRVSTRLGLPIDQTLQAIEAFIGTYKDGGWKDHIRSRTGEFVASNVEVANKASSKQPVVFSIAKIDDAPISNDEKKAVLSLGASLAVHDTVEDAQNYLGENRDDVPAAWYDPKSNTIHIVGSTRKETSLIHEVAHPYITAKLENDSGFVDKAFDIISKKDNSISNYAKVYGKKEAVIEYFARKYKEGNTSKTAKKKMGDVIRLFFNDLTGKSPSTSEVDTMIKDFYDAIEDGIVPKGDKIEFQRLTPEIAKVRSILERMLPKVGTLDSKGNVITRDMVINAVAININISRQEVDAIASSIEQDAIVSNADKLFPSKGMPKKIENFWNRYLSARKGLPKELLQFSEAMKGAIIWEIKTAQNLYNKANKLLSGFTDEEIHIALTEGIMPNNATDEQKTIIERLRTHIDNLSMVLIDEGYVHGVSAAIIADNIGSYMTRAFAIHLDKDYTPTEEAYQNAIRHYTKYWMKILNSSKNHASLSAKEKEALAKEYATRDVNDILAKHKDRDYSAKHIANIAKDSGILKRRKDMPKEVISLIEKVKTGESYTDNEVRDAVNALYEYNKRFEEVKEKNIKNYKRVPDKEIYDQAQKIIENVRNGMINGLEYLTDIDRALLGEYKGLDAYLLTVYRLANLVEKSRFLNNVHAWGVGRFFFKKNDLLRPVDHNVKVVPQSQSYSPLTGLYTSEEIANAIRDIDEIFNMPFDAKAWHKFVGIVNWGKTVGSPITHARNVFGNIPFIIGNGYISMMSVSAGMNAIKVALMETGFIDPDTGRLIWNAKNKEDIKSVWKELVSNGVIGSNVHMGILRDLLGADSLSDMLEKINKHKKKGTLKTMADAFSDVIKKTAKPFNIAYSIEDDVFKVFAYLMERDRYARAVYGVRYKELNDVEAGEIDSIVIEIVKNVLPNYDRIGELGKTIGRSFFLSNFVAFQIEATRVTYNAMAIGIKEMKSANNKIKAIGIRRVIGGLAIPAIRAAFVGFFGKAAGVGLSGLMGLIFDSEEEDKRKQAIRYFSYPWQRYSDLVVARLENGKSLVYDLSSTDPMGNWNRAMNALMYAEENNAAIAAWQIVSPYLEPRIATQIAAQMLQGEDSKGNKIILKDDTYTDKTWKLINFALAAAGPGVISQTKRFIDAEDKAGELFGMATGMKPYEFDYAQSLTRKMYELFGWKNSVISERFDYLTRQSYNRKISDQTFYWLLSDLENKLKHAVMEGHKAVQYAKILNVPEEAIIEAINRAVGVSKRTTKGKSLSVRDMILQGEFSIEPWQNRINKLIRNRESLYLK